MGVLVAGLIATFIAVLLALAAAFRSVSMGVRHICSRV
jgi:hypothetical protein